MFGMIPPYNSSYLEPEEDFEYLPTQSRFMDFMNPQEPEKSSRGIAGLGSLEEMLSGFDKYGRYGIDDDDRQDAGMRGIGALLKNAGRYAIARSQGNQDVQDKIALMLPDMYGDTVDAELDDRGQKKLAAQLSKLDMSGKYTELEKDELAVKLAQDQYDQRKRSREIMSTAFKQEFTEENKEQILAQFPNEAVKSLKRAQIASIEALMAMGEPEKAMEMYQNFIKDVPDEVKRNLENLEDMTEAKAYGEQHGENRADEEYNQHMMEQVGGDAGGLTRVQGKLVPMLPSEKTEQELDFANKRKQGEALDMNRKRDQAYIDNLGEDKGAGSAKTEKAIRDALASVNYARKGSYKIGQNERGIEALYTTDKDGKSTEVRGMDPVQARKIMDQIKRAEKDEEILRQYGYDVDSDAPLVFKPIGGSGGSGDPKEQRRAEVLSWWSSDASLKNLDAGQIAALLGEKYPDLSLANAISVATRLKSNTF